jgi:ABC-type dipeptide/oligopeptide/nickel transport system permease component
MKSFFVKRAIYSGIMLIALSMLIFLMIHVTGDPISLLAPLDAKPEDFARIIKLYGLDKPIHVQYLQFVKEALRGNLGMSYQYNQPTLHLVLGRLPATLTLAFATMMIACLVAIPVGSISAIWKGKPVEKASLIGSLLGISIPPFWLGILLILVFAEWLRWFPASGRGGLSHVILPAFSLALSNIGLIIRLVHTNMDEVLSQDYIVTARAKGLRPSKIYLIHALKNSLAPAINIVGLQFGTLLGGSVVIETVFAWPGVGWLLYQSVINRDLPLTRTIAFLMALFFIVINLLVDLTCKFLDPRIKLE